MQVEIACPHCGALFRVNAEFAGRTAACKRCGGKFKLVVSAATGAPKRPATDLPAIGEAGALGSDPTVGVEGTLNGSSEGRTRSAAGRSPARQRPVDIRNRPGPAVARQGSRTPTAASGGGDAHEPPDYMTGFNAVKGELIARFGPDEGGVFASSIPLCLDPQRGLAESLTFRRYVPGFAYCTCALSLYRQQKPGPNGNYELMMCSREEAPFIPGALGNLAKYTFQAVLKPGDTIDWGPSQPPGSNIRGLLGAVPQMTPETFTLYGRRCTVLLLLGITRAELNACREFGSEGVLLKLKTRNVYPYTTLSRESLI